MHGLVRLPVALLVFAAAACTPRYLPRDIAPIPAATPVPGLENARLAPIELSRVTFNIPRGKQIGVSYYDFFSCGGPYSRQLIWSSDRADGLNLGFADAFYREMTAAHFSVVGDPTKQFRTKNERSEFLMGALVTDMDANICERVYAREKLDRERGEATMDVTWQIFSNTEQRVVYTTKTRGYAKIDEAVSDGGHMVVQNAFAAAAANLAGDKGFVDLLRRDQLARSPEPAPVADAALRLAAVPQLTDPIARNIALVRAATVTVLIGDGGHGSGFFITDQGHLLTNHHVVGDAQTIPVRLSNGTTVTGRVLRRHPARDVALVKIDAVGTQPLAVRQQAPQIAEEVYAIGTPRDRALAATVTRGIVSAVRRFAEDGGLPRIQADVAISSGNSGGPLVDAKGNLLGICVATFRGATGVNFFIPIDDALQKLNIEIKS